MGKSFFGSQSTKPALQILQNFSWLNLFLMMLKEARKARHTVLQEL
jgi:hypothetical protein